MPGHAGDLIPRRLIFDNPRRVLARDHAEIIRSRDGLELVSYLTLPPGCASSRPGRPARPLPTVLVVHGGP